MANEDKKATIGLQPAGTPLPEGNKNVLRSVPMPEVKGPDTIEIDGVKVKAAPVEMPTVTVDKDFVDNMPRMGVAVPSDLKGLDFSGDDAAYSGDKTLLETVKDVLNGLNDALGGLSNKLFGSDPEATSDAGGPKVQGLKV